jgi:tRNA-(ms[2]io[6]A)-hydroxylase
VKDLDAVLVDHAHCEMKAATNALSLVVRHPDDLEIVRALSAIAREELEHFQRVVDFLAARGLSLGHPPVDDYAAALRRKMNELPASDLPLLVDRLLVGALIEARSCERFRLLADALAARLDPLASFYEELFACEARHYTTLVDVAVEVRGDEPLVRARLAELARIEGEIAARLGARPTMHG